MEVVVDLDKVVVTFRDMENLDTVAVVVAVPSTASSADDAAVHRLADVLAATNVGELEGTGAHRAWINPAAAQFHAAGQVDPGWTGRVEDRCARSAGRGGRHALEAEVVWPGDVGRVTGV